MIHQPQQHSLLQLQPSIIMNNPLQFTSPMSVPKAEQQLHDLPNDESCLCKATRSILRISSASFSSPSSTSQTNFYHHHHQVEHDIVPPNLYNLGGTTRGGGGGRSTNNNSNNENNNTTGSDTTNLDRTVDCATKISSQATCYLPKQNRDDVDDTGFYWLPSCDDETDYDISETESDSDSDDDSIEDDDEDDDDDDDGDSSEDEYESITRHGFKPNVVVTQFVTTSKRVQFPKEVISEIHFIPKKSIREYGLFFYSCHELQKMKDEADQQTKQEES